MHAVKFKDVYNTVFVLPAQLFSTLIKEEFLENQISIIE